MLTQTIKRHGEDLTRRRGDRSANYDRPVPVSPRLRVFFLALFTGIILTTACGSKPIDPRTVIPGDALVYLESSDLGRTLAAITDNPKFEAAAKFKPDFGALSGIKISIAVTGFETSEQAVTEENAVLNFQPRFVAVVETNAWGWQTTGFIENQLGEFVNEAYGGDVQLDISLRNDGKYFVWTSPDGRKAYALQQDSLVFFGNDETALERCQAVKRGEAESIAKNPKITNDDRIAFGYISPQGIGQIANIAGVSLAMRASEEDEVKSFVAGVLPEILRNSVKDMTWTASTTEKGIEDRVVITLDDESARVGDETLAPSPAGESQLTDLVPASAASSTRYLLRDPQIAWRSVVLTARKKTDETSGALIAAFSASLFEAYGIEDPELFLSAVGSQIMTVKLAADSEDAAVIASIKDSANARRAIAKEINLTRPPEKQFGGDFWKSDDGELAAALIADRMIVGDAETVLKCLEAKQAGGNAALAQQLALSDAVATTVVNETDSIGRLIDVLSERKNENERIPMQYRTETRFNNNGIERRTVSDFGLIGSIIEQLAQE
ncbi:hypothetical protein BH18ACI3_BH18ACI3_14980 [soil metagenome]